MNWKIIIKKDKEDMVEGKVYTSDRAGKKFMQVIKNMVITKVKERIEAVELILIKSAGIITKKGISVNNVKARLKLLNV